MTGMNGLLLVYPGTGRWLSRDIDDESLSGYYSHLRVIVASVVDSLTSRSQDMDVLKLYTCILQTAHSRANKGVISRVVLL